MARNGNVNFHELQQFKETVEQSLGSDAVDAFIASCAKELAARLLAKVIKRTPVGEYPKGAGKKGGTLRRGWTGGQSSNGAAYAQSLKVNQFGGTYVIEVVNPVEYASYVEFGHRQEPGRYVPAIGKRLKKGWVEGQFMLTISEAEVQADAPKILENKLKKKLGEVFR